MTMAPSRSSFLLKNSVSSIHFYLPCDPFLETLLFSSQVRTRASLDGAAFGRLPRLVSFAGSRVSVRRADGASMTAAVSPFAAQLHALCAHAQFAKAVCGIDIFSESEMFFLLECACMRDR
jgi:hypothetical protein